MKKTNLLSLLFLAGMLVSCGPTNPDSGNNGLNNLGTIETPTFFENKYDEEKIPNQWSAYGCGDPFVLRYNGRYYLYVSTKNFETGVRGWVSDDLIHYEPMTGEGCETGYVSMDPCTVTAYAPEVMYYNGYFYMAQSQGGNGHYILRSEKPEGPFVAITGNFGESIDGSFFIDDDEQIYFLRASNTGIRIIQVNDDFTMGSSRTLDNTVLGGWTEGPYMLKRDGNYFLTYTGNSVTSEGYRIAYSYSQDEVFDREAFTEGGLIVLSTDEDYNGLGHSSTVMGPDLDSYYLAYHNLNSSGGPNRSNNIARLSFSGTEMIVEHAELYNNITPTRPTFETADASGLETVGNFSLSPTTTEKVFSAEYNFIGNNVQAVFSYIDENNYSYVRLNSGELSLHKIVNGSENFSTSVTLNKEYDYSKLHTLRVAYKDNKTIVYFDNLNKISTLQATFEPGKIGYVANSNATWKYTAFSNVAHGSSCNEQIHQNRFLAGNYSDSSFSTSNLLINDYLAEEDGRYYNGKVGSYDLNLNAKGDGAAYKIYVEEDGRYGIDMTLLDDHAGKKVVIQIDDNPATRFTIPSNNGAPGYYYKTYIGDVEMSKGTHYFKIYSDGDNIRLHDVEYYKTSASNPSFESDLSNYVTTGARYINSWKLRDDGHYALAGNRNLLYFGDDTLKDCTIEIDIELVGETQTSTCGLILRASNPAFASSDTYSSIQGYYVGFNNSKLFISKCNYNNSELDAAVMPVKSESDVMHHLKVDIRGNVITADIDNGKEIISFTDSIGFTHGSFGLYTDGAASIYRNLKITY